MQADQRQTMFTLLSEEFFESLERYQATSEFLDVVKAHTGEGWSLRPRGFWTHCIPDGAVLLTQGWKIHVSAVGWTGEETLRRTLPVLAGEGVPFKFCSDRRMLELSTGKNWARTGAGKFITVYPGSEDQFVRLAQRLHEVTSDLRGPFILTDRPYADSKVVFYRYGGHMGRSRLDSAGREIPMLVAPDGSEVPDQRKPFFTLPDWVQDPFEASVEEAPAEIVLNGRYRMTGAIRFSSVGGLYHAIDTHTGDQVVVREARPMIAGRREAVDAQARLEKEARILQKMADTGLTPRFVDLFREWDHLFLVQERVEGHTLWDDAIEWTKSYSHRERPTGAELFASLRGVAGRLVDGLQAFHDRGIVLRDLTKGNVLVAPDGRLLFIDFELAFEDDREDPAVSGGTPGYVSPQQARNRTRPAPSDDHFALGALLMDVISFNAAALPLNREGGLASFQLFVDDLGLPRELYEGVTGLLDPEAETRWTPERLLAALDGAAPRPARVPAAGSPALPRPTAPADAVRAEMRDTVAGVARYILAHADYTRTDRVWPSSPEAYTTNPVGLQFGAAGIARFLLRTTGDVPGEAVDWIRAALKTRTLPAGLYNGVGGAALLLADLGLHDEARERMRDAARLAPTEDPGLYHGAAGWGLANLALWQRTGDDECLARARETGDRLLRTAQADADGIYWENAGRVNFGLGHGGSGVATFLAYLHAAEPDAATAAAAERALDYEAAQVDPRFGLYLWREHREGGNGPRLPHMRYGTAGIGQAALRVHAATGAPRFRALAERCARDLAARHGNKLWQDFGSSGFGELLVDAYRFLGDPRWLDSALHLAEGILTARIRRPEGVAFAGMEQLRIACDVGMGSAGIGLFMHRALNPHHSHILFPDELLRTRAAADAVNSMNPLAEEVGA